MSSIAELVADALRSGIVHPGDKKKGIPQRQIALPFGPSAGRPKEMQDLVDGTVKLLSEAIVSTIEVGHEIVPRDELEALQAAAPEVGETVAVHCRCNPTADPLVLLTVTHPGRAVLEGGALIRGLSNRSEKCPHGWGKQ